MTCRHLAGDPACSSTKDGWRSDEIERENREYREKVAVEAARAQAKRESKQAAEIYAMTPDAAKYEVIQATRVGPHLVMKVQYPNCTKCSYEGNKVMVFLNMGEMDALKWRHIDPHFRDPKAVIHPSEAPGPAARFPASDEGWNDALAYAHKKQPPLT